MRAPRLWSSRAWVVCGRTAVVIVALLAGGTAPGAATGLVARVRLRRAEWNDRDRHIRFGEHGTVAGATRTTSGRYGSALTFAGVNDWVTVNDAASLDLTTGMTLEPGTAQVSLNAWTHLAATWDEATVRLYVNGAQVSSRAVAGTMPNSARALRIGGTPSGRNGSGAGSTRYASTTAHVAGQAEAFRTTATAAGSVTKLSIYVDSTSTATSLVAGIYAANGAHPGMLLGQGSRFMPLTGAWNDVQTPPSP